MRKKPPKSAQREESLTRITEVSVYLLQDEMDSTGCCGQGCSFFFFLPPQVLINNNHTIQSWFMESS